MTPPPAPIARPRRAPREMWNAIFWALRSGAPWRDIPECHGLWESAYSHFNTWRRKGVFERVLQAPQIRLDAEGISTGNCRPSMAARCEPPRRPQGPGKGGSREPGDHASGPLARRIREQAPPGC
ncbi:MAG: transposase [Candidatus Eisenbacteria bacterium]|uniref:Transposase n=1 Tax=Eiseniibacteriota bacterium TaxID=2212470 RepID=A0A849STW2_UNCEI|nr:transposase [Candidatus Eisenbacteria bacterium]